jgi:hypothetical protein
MKNEVDLITERIKENDLLIQDIEKSKTTLLSEYNIGHISPKRVPLDKIKKVKEKTEAYLIYVDDHVSKDKTKSLPSKNRKLLNSLYIGDLFQSTSVIKLFKEIKGEVTSLIQTTKTKKSNTIFDKTKNRKETIYRKKENTLSRGELINRSVDELISRVNKNKELHSKITARYSYGEIEKQELYRLYTNSRRDTHKFNQLIDKARNQSYQIEENTIGLQEIPNGILRFDDKLRHQYAKADYDITTSFAEYTLKTLERAILIDLHDFEDKLSLIINSFIAKYSHHTFSNQRYGNEEEVFFANSAQHTLLKVIKLYSNRLQVVEKLTSEARGKHQNYRDYHLIFVKLVELNNGLLRSIHSYLSPPSPIMRQATNRELQNKKQSYEAIVDDFLSEIEKFSKTENLKLNEKCIEYLFQLKNKFINEIEFIKGGRPELAARDPILYVRPNVSDKMKNSILSSTIHKQDNEVKQSRWGAMLESELDIIYNNSTVVLSTAHRDNEKQMQGTIFEIENPLRGQECITYKSSHSRWL